MNTNTDRTHKIEEEIQALRREVAEARHEMAHLIAAVARQERSQQQLRRDLNKHASHAGRVLPAAHAGEQVASGAPSGAEIVPNDPLPSLAVVAERLGKVEYEVDKIQFFAGVTDKELQDVRATLYRFERRHAWIEGFLRQLEMWVHALAERIFPRAFYFSHGELYRRFPKGFADVPSYLFVPKKADQLGKQRKTPWEY